MRFKPNLVQCSVLGVVCQLFILNTLGTYRWHLAFESSDCGCPCTTCSESLGPLWTNTASIVWASLRS